MSPQTKPSASLSVSVASGSQPPSLKSPVQTRQANFRYVRSGTTTVILDPETGQELHRHADLWFKDGSVICQAERTLFRVHISQLSRHSALFRDIFTLPQPSRPRSWSLSSLDTVDDTRIMLEECENCPAVVLQDKADDVANFLAALYDGPNFGNNDQEDFRVVSGILRLSTKYIVDSLRSKALTHLCLAWPSTLKGWDAREDVARSYEMVTSASAGHFYPSPVAVINLAREISAPCLLPAAFYDLSRYSYSQIYEPAEDEPLFRSPVPESLLPLDMQRLALGKEAAQHNITALIQTMGHAQTHIRNQSATHTHVRKNSSGGICMSAAACRKDFSELVELATQHYLFDRERGHCDPLYVSEELGQLKSAEFSECKACARSLETWAAKEREKMWKMIPLWFRLETPAEGSVKVV
ncbi:BTB domain-containing protein [Mycena venus]|uniref:BTB domain-containing protein n=1 Tax=Mycena venus TaxID=2733690 RepID=A0A8H6YE36_9AGAR|nr:BTB domain-containing protein [Mycena venus]